MSLRVPPLQSLKNPHANLAAKLPPVVAPFVEFWRGANRFLIIVLEVFARRNRYFFLRHDYANDNMKKHDVPFTLVADESYDQFEANGVKKSFGKFMWGAAKSPLTLLQATLRGYVPLTMSISKLSTIPVDILIDEDGKVVEAHYCKDTADHLPLEKMIAFSHGQL